MLILSRRPGEVVVIPIPGSSQMLRVTAVGTHNGQIRLGFDAPREIEIYREEVYLDKVHAEQSTVEDDGEHAEVRHSE